jgi:hypothetical protein
MDYKQKYLKYKEKYLRLKAELQGGLITPNVLDKSDNLQNTLQTDYIAYKNDNDNKEIFNNIEKQIKNATNKEENLRNIIPKTPNLIVRVPNQNKFSNITYTFKPLSEFKKKRITYRTHKTDIYQQIKYIIVNIE